MADLLDNGHGPTAPPAVAQVTVMVLADGAMRVGLSPGLPLDVAESHVYRALKFLEREITLQVIAARTPRVDLARGLIPRGPFPG